MAALLPIIRSKNHALAWALLFSLLLHIVAVAQLPNLRFDQPAVVENIIKIELAPLAKPEPPPALPEPAAPKPPIKPRERVKPQPTPVKPLPKPAAIAETGPPIQASEPPPQLAPQPHIIATAPKAEAPPPPVIVPPPPPPEPVKPAGPSQQEIDAARGLYGSLLQREIAKHKQYPRIAQMRGWQGEAMVELQIDNSGNILSSKIQNSSGFEVLDKQALEMVRKAAPLPVPPEALRGRSFNILVPVSFRLE